MRTRGRENTHNLDEDVVLFISDSAAMCLKQVFRVAAFGVVARSDPVVGHPHKWAGASC